MSQNNPSCVEHSRGDCHVAAIRFANSADHCSVSRDPISYLHCPGRMDNAMLANGCAAEGADATRSVQLLDSGVKRSVAMRAVPLRHGQHPSEGRGHKVEYRNARFYGETHLR